MKRTPAILTIRLNPTGDDQEKQEWTTVEIADEGLLSMTQMIDSASVVNWAKEMNQAAEWMTILLQYGNNEKSEGAIQGDPQRDGSVRNREHQTPGMDAS